MLQYRAQEIRDGHTWWQQPNREAACAAGAELERRAASGSAILWFPLTLDSSVLAIPPSLSCWNGNVCYIAEVGLELLIPLPLAPGCWVCRCDSPRPAGSQVFKNAHEEPRA